MDLEIALKVDVCNRRSLDQGVPGLLAVLGETGVPASFFVAFGPDHSGRAIRRLFRPGFLRKMVRTRAPRMYGWRTLLYGTLLPGPPVGESAPGLLRRLEDEGHEVGLHGYDHVGWHDGVARMTRDQVRASLEAAASRFEAAVGHAPRFSGAPGWQVTKASLLVQEELALDFASDCRDGAPFYPEVDGKPLRTLQLPTTLSTSDEVLGAGLASQDGLAEWYRDAVSGGGCHVIGIHAEAEGIHFSAWLRRFLHEMRGSGARFVRLSELALRSHGRAGRTRIARRLVPGRADPVACPEARA